MKTKTSHSHIKPNYKSESSDKWRVSVVNAISDPTLSLKDVSELFNLKYQAFSIRFKRKFSTTPAKYRDDMWEAKAIYMSVTKDNFFNVTKASDLLKNTTKYLEAISLQCGYSNENDCEEITRIFKKITGLSPIKLREVFWEKNGTPKDAPRIKKATKLALSTNMKAQEIAAECGFFVHKDIWESARHFAVYFKRYTGLPLKEFREKYKDNNKEIELINSRLALD